jgi:transposase InsO family protein
VEHFADDYFSPYIIPTVDHIPWTYKNIPIPPGIRNEVVEIIREKIAAGVYEPSQASYRSQWFCVKKKSGKLRIVHDLQPLNGVTIRDADVPPILDEFVEPFAQQQCGTVFDLYWGYDARKIDVKSRDMTTFWTPLGLLRLTSLPMGFTNSVAEFQKCMTFILKDEIPHVADMFIDDCPIKGPKSQYLDAKGEPETIPENPGIRRFIWEHAVNVHRIMHRVSCSGATFSGKKTQICRPEVTILGQKCTPHGRLPEEEKVSKILNWPQPKTVRDVRGFLGLCGVVRIWIKDYSMIIWPLTELWRKNQIFVWNERQEEAFQKLKKIIISPPALRPIDYDSHNPVILAVDSSYLGVGIILSQIDEQGKKHPARFGSIPFNKREANYGQPKLELYGLYRALRAYRYHLHGAKKLHVEVDARYIKGMLKKPDLQPNAAMNRWIQGILLFDFELIHVPAVEFKGPDALSRREPTKEEIEQARMDDDWLDEIALYSIVPDFPPLPQTNHSHSTLPSFLVDGTKADQTLCNVKAFLEDEVVPQFANDQAKKRFLVKTQEFFVQNGHLYKKRRQHSPLRVILTAEERLRILTQAHEGLAHRGIHGVFQTIRDRFYWPRLHQDVEHHVKSCHECQIRSTKKVEIPITISAPATIFSKIYVDVMLMPRAQGYRYIVAARDDLSLAAEGRALRKNSAAALSKFFWEEIICRYGAIGEVVTDNGPEIKGAFEGLMRRYGIPQIRISAYNSKANGVVERGHFVIREGIIKACEGNVNQWPTKVHHAFFADKCINRKSTGFSPFYLLYGVDPVLPFDLTEATYLVHGFHSGMTTEELLALRIRQLEKRPDDLAHAAATIRQARLHSKEQFEELFKRRLTTHVFKQGELVLVRNSQVEKELDRKSKPRYLGPYQIVRQTKGGSYVLKELDGAVSQTWSGTFQTSPICSKRRKRTGKNGVRRRRTNSRR